MKGNILLPIVVSLCLIGCKNEKQSEHPIELESHLRHTPSSLKYPSLQSLQRIYNSFM